MRLFVISLFLGALALGGYVYLKPSAANNSEFATGNQSSRFEGAGPRGDGARLPAFSVGGSPSLTGTDGRKSVSVTSKGSVGSPVPASKASSFPENSAKIEALLIAKKTEAARGRYGAYFDQAGIPETARAKVIVALVNSDLTFRDIAALSKSEGMSKSDRLQLMNENSKNYIAQLQEALGSEGASAFLAYRASLPFQPAAQAFASRCASQGIAIPADTVDTVAVLLTHSQAYRAAVLEKTPNGNWETLEHLEQRALTDASKILTPQQIVIFRQVLIEGYNPWSGSKSAR